MGLELETEPTAAPDDPDGPELPWLPEGRPRVPPLPKPKAPSRNGITEAQAMLQIETALEQLDDAERGRVVRWIEERWYRHIVRDQKDGFVPTISGIKLDREMPFEDITKATAVRRGIFDATVLDEPELRDAEAALSVAEAAADIIDHIVPALPTDDSFVDPDFLAATLVNTFARERLVGFVQAFSYDVISLGDKTHVDTQAGHKFLMDLWLCLHARLGLTYDTGR